MLAPHSIPHPIMASNFNFTDKAQQTIADSIQLAKDYANAQGNPPFYENIRIIHTFYPPVTPVHIAFVLINEGQGEALPGGPPSSGSSRSQSLFASVISRAGGDPVRYTSSSSNHHVTDV